MQTYPMVHAIVRYGAAGTWLIAIAVLGTSTYFAFQAGSIILAVVGLLAAVMAFVLLKSYCELVSIIADMMLPK